MKHYYDEYIKAINPKIIISLSDNWPIFYNEKSQMIQKNNYTKSISNLFANRYVIQFKIFEEINLLLIVIIY